MNLGSSRSKFCGRTVVASLLLCVAGCGVRGSTHVTRIELESGDNGVNSVRVGERSMTCGRQNVVRIAGSGSASSFGREDDQAGAVEAALREHVPDIAVYDEILADQTTAGRYVILVDGQCVGTAHVLPHGEGWTSDIIEYGR